MATLAGDPSGLIGGRVSAITGNLVLRHQDLVVQGHEPLSFSRVYVGNSEKNVGRWRFFLDYLTLKCYRDKVEKLGQKNIYKVALVPEKTGITLLYGVFYPSKYKIDMGYILMDGQTLGITNCSSGEISARLNLLRNRVVQNKDQNIFYIYQSDGGVRYYERADSYDMWGKRIKNKHYSEYRLKLETLPNGNKIIYEYDKKYCIKFIKSTDSTEKTTYAWIKFEYTDNAIHLTTSDNKSISYTTGKSGQGYSHLEKVISTDKPTESFEYNDRSVLLKKILPDNRFLKCDYDSDNRIKALYSPLREKKEEKTLELSYKTGRAERKGGKTSALDAEGNLKEYKFNDRFLLTKINHFLKNDKPLFSEIIGWGKNEQANWLKAKSISDENGKIIFSRFYNYDDHGNIIEDIFVGNLTGEKDTRVKLNKKDHPILKESEVYKLIKTYQPRNHLLSRIDFPNGKKIYYIYKKNTNLISKKFIYDKKTRKIRHHYIYDGTVLIKEIIDDGDNHDENDLTGVTERHIKEISPRKKEPFAGVPESIRQYYLDLPSGERKLLFRKELSYDEFGNLEKEGHFDANDQYLYSIEYKYDEKNRLKYKTDPMGKPTTARYDANNNMKEKSSSEQDFSITTEYDYGNREITKEQDPSYGSKKTFAFSYNNLHQKVEQIDPQGNSTYWKYDPMGNPTEINYPEMVMEDGSIISPTTKKTYTPLGKVSNEIDANGYQTKTTYTARGTPIKVIHPDSSEERYTYYINGKLKTYTSPTGTKTHYTYDVLDRELSKKVTSKDGKFLYEETSTYNSLHLLSKTAANGTITAYKYDGAGRKIEEKTNNKVTTFSYDARGRLSETKNFIDKDHFQIEKIYYDSLDRTIEKRQEDQDGVLYSYTQYSHDDFNNEKSLTKEVKIGKSVTKKSYDCFKRLIETVDPLGYVTRVIYNDAFVNEHGLTVVQKTTIDPKNRKTIETYNTHGKQVSIEKYSCKNILLLKETLFYDPANNKTKQVSNLYHPEKTFIKSWSYDSRNRVTSLIENETKITSYTYTPSGKIKTIVQPDESVITYTYDFLDRVTEVSTSDQTCHYRLTYNHMDKITLSEDLIHQTKTERKYNCYGELLEETLANGLSIDRTYDLLGRKTSLTLPDESKALYTYDPYHLSKITRLGSNEKILYCHKYLDYDLSHNLIKEELPNGLSAKHDIDLLGRNMRITSELHLLQIKEFDPCGNILSHNSFLPRDTFKTELTYDDLDQVTSEKGFFCNNYSYDSHHNRLSKDEQTYLLNDHHQLKSTQNNSYSYDLNGNCKEENGPDKKISYEYDGLGRPTCINIDGKNLKLVYDYWNRLISKQDDEKKIDYIYDQQNELGSLDELRVLGNGKGAEIGATIAIEFKAIHIFPLHDLFGNISILTTIKKQPIQIYHYSCFGEEKVLTGFSFTTPWGFQSKRKIAHLIDFGRRFYDPSIGRFISPDPKGYEKSPNLYHFVQNNSLIHFDLWGEESVDRYNSQKSDQFNTLVYGPIYAKLAKDGTLENTDWGRYIPRDLHLPSYSYHLEKKEPKFGMITFINGMDNGFRDNFSSTGYLSEQAGGINIHSIFNRSRGRALDTTECVFQSVTGCPTLSAISLLSKWLDHFSKKPQSEVLHFCHSQGSIVTRNVAPLLPESIRQKITVVSIAPGAYVDKDTYGKVLHYVCEGDFVPKIDFIGRIRNRDTITTLKANPDDKGSVHSFQHPVYREKIKEHIDDFFSNR